MNDSIRNTLGTVFDLVDQIIRDDPMDRSCQYITGQSMKRLFDQRKDT